MPWLDCHDIDVALVSLADGISVSRGELERALRDYDETRFSDYSEDPQARMPREVLEGFGTELAAIADRLAGVYYFHGTRVGDPGTFGGRGVLPLGQMVEEIWELLCRLVREELSREQWAEFRRSVEEEDAGGHDGWLYRLKTVGGGLGAQVNQGPYGMVVREFLFQPEQTGSHDYLGCPEIVQDIARCFHSTHGVDLEARFCAATVPCIVKIRSTEVLPGAIEAALWFSFSMLRDGELTGNARWGYDYEGRAVPPEDVVDVEVVKGR